MPRGRPRKKPAGKAPAQPKRRPGRPRKARQESAEGVLMRSAEFIGWALGGIEREISETRNRLAALTDKAGELRSRLGLGGPDTRRRRTAAAGEAATQRQGRRRRRRRRLTPEQRAAISERMRRTWAERRKAR